MPKAIPKGLEKEHVLAAMRDLDAGVNHKFGTPTKFLVLYQGKQYPPKAVIGLAFKYLTGSILSANEFSGGEAVGQANFELRQLGFDVVPLAEAENSYERDKDGSSKQSFLLTWNPEKWNDWDYEVLVQRTSCAEICPRDWSTGNRTEISPNQRVYLLRQGNNQGIIGAGYTTSTGFQSLHWDGSGRTANKVKVDFVTLLPASDVLTIEKLAQYELGVSWRYIQASGVAVPDSSADQLESLWNAHLISLDRKQEVLPHELIAPSQYVEGAVKRAYVNRYERSSKARKKCLEIYGHNCIVCDFNFEDVFGKLGSKYIHVHHLRELAMVGEQYEVNPENDLRPVCPNCHAMLHNGEKLLSIEELKEIRNSSAK